MRWRRGLLDGVCVSPLTLQELLLGRRRYAAALLGLLLPEAGCLATGDGSPLRDQLRRRRRDKACVTLGETGTGTGSRRSESRGGQTELRKDAPRASFIRRRRLQPPSSSSSCRLPCPFSCLLSIDSRSFIYPQPFPVSEAFKKKLEETTVCRSPSGQRLLPLLPPLVQS